MPLALIYLDTSIWNILAEQTPDEDSLCDHLSKRGAQMTLGLNAYYELLRTFYGTKPDKMRRGQRLFTCVRRFLRRGVRLLKTWEQLLIEEAEMAPETRSSIDPFESGEFEKAMTVGAAELSFGRLDSRLEGMVSRRDAVNSKVIEAASAEVKSQPELLSDLKEIESDDVSAFLTKASTEESGRRLLARHLRDLFVDFKRTAPKNCEQLACSLLKSEVNRTAHALVRVDMYYHWRAAKKPRFSLRNCLANDAYHVVNASYCRGFVTEDRDGQADAAKQAIPGLKPLIYRDRKVPFSGWLLKTVADGLVD